MKPDTHRCVVVAIALVGAILLSAACATASASTYSSSVTSTHGLVAYWRLGEVSGTVATDSFGTSNGTYGGGYKLGVAGAIVGDSNTAASFDGISGQVSLPSLGSASSWTIEGWTNLSFGPNSSAGANNTLYAGYGGVRLLVRPSGVYADDTSSGTKLGIMQPTTPSNVGTWVYWVLVRSGSTLTVYRNGAQIATSSLGTEGPSLLNGYIGSGTGMYYLNGSADEVAVYTSALSASTVAGHYNASGRNTVCTVTLAPGSSVQSAIDGNPAGSTICLENGTYTEDVTVDKSNDTLTSVSGQRGTLVGRLYLPPGDNGTTVSWLHLDGKNSQNLPSPTVDDDRAYFTGNDVQNENTAICFNLGYTGAGYGPATNTEIVYNRIHNCGSDAGHDHGIYVEYSTNVWIWDNVIYDNASRGIQYYPTAQGSFAWHNVIDDNAEDIDFGSDGGTFPPSSSNQNFDNLVTDATTDDGVQYYWATVSGSGNTVANGCFWNNYPQDYATPTDGFSVSGMTNRNPLYQNGAAGQLYPTDSTCRGYLGPDEIPYNAAP